MWQFDSCVVAKDSHSKIHELDDKLKALERLYQGIYNKNKDDALTQNLNVNLKPH